jgi:SAM-dependent methyltransferase
MVGQPAQAYGDGSGLDLKWAVMRRFRTNDESFEDWLIRQLPLGPKSRVLDCGAGSGRLSIPIAQRLQGGSGTLVALDISADVMEPIRTAVEAESLPIESVIGDAAEPPVEPASFDIVLAAHMVYHLSDLAAGLKAMKRCLRRGGVLVATTNAARGMPEMYEIHVATMSELGMPYGAAPPDETFTLENGKTILERVFDDVELRSYDGGFAASSADPVFSYYAGTQLYREPMRNHSLSWQRRLLIGPTFVHLAQERVEAAGGKLIVSKDIGTFWCRAD